jgi:hypothetical protein
MIELACGMPVGARIIAGSSGSVRCFHVPLRCLRVPPGLRVPHVAVDYSRTQTRSKDLLPEVNEENYSTA